ncbi:CD209 antigen isoform X2 [Neophocaena asiaeorientalis asiaeorientalis]|uniref:CD209 antigen isoform X2 n=1 Tax=Neophocaena asiaeorientalis asiaeorientalis TaxID=1706337 RepID=A0A341BJ11_NEOAA|nr:CD209 antigen isoform X2 [Neophocaena asiaeorientalis asiaeorientalis]
MMAEMCNPKEPGGSEEETFGGRTLAERHPGLLRSLRSSPGCLTQNPLLPLLLFISLAFFMLQLTTLVQVSRIQFLQRDLGDHHVENNSLDGGLDAGFRSQRGDGAPREHDLGPTITTRVDVAQGQMRSNLEEILQRLTWMNATLTGLCRPCPWNWEFFQGSCYLFSWTQSDWKSAVSSCKDIGAQLVIIKSPEEQKFLKIWYVRYNKPTWIGLSDHHNEGTWKWVDNSPLQLSFWKKGEPNNHEDEDCVELYNDGWNDGKCSTQNSWICEKPSSPCPAL